MTIDTHTTRSTFAADIQTAATRADGLEAARAMRAGTAGAPLEVARLTMHVAAVAPEELVGVYDGLTEGWVGRAPDAPDFSSPGASGEIPVEFLDALWALIDDPRVRHDPGDITVRTAALAWMLPASLHGRVAKFAPRYPGVTEGAAAGLPAKFRLEELAAGPPGSLAARLHSLVIDKGFDLEVLDRDELGLSGLEPPLDYLNVRILQCHDVWHEVAGYETTGLHEVAISGFQMGQFGHHYSSMFLAMVFTKAALTQPPEAMPFLLDVILMAYLHGRETPPLLPVHWEALWDMSIDEIRSQLGVVPYDSPYPAGILEDMLPE